MPDASARYLDPALLIVDMQNDFVRVGAPLEVPDARATLPSHARLIAAFRAKGLPVVYTKFLSTEEPSLLWTWSPQCAPPVCLCRRGVSRVYGDAAGPLDCTDVVTEIHPQPDDLVVEKYGYSGFHGTSLSGRLRQKGVRSLVVTGTVTQICVEDTARGAFHHGFRTTMVEDAVSSFAPELHAAALKNFAMKFGWVDSSASVVAALGA
ncbi:cysteine hydrolase [Rhodoplanes sp. TEM]|uniref:Cysteine hydrolase n=1 Tax=Rhodoplanes tepidamans TaxID=200616 RepID=A0ABT5JCM8_RHOTP|nr:MULTISPECIES: isochorismatase family cysteine hydrolase [Rhodoplanes]MDC7787426.1 cysteine hydrolase [Rhodoplanes tepidamans]MDC7987695.1 cysteine hydrolase [Rhodoplanes sp. TEM]MDQ0358088.1 nicotinamidase-related amidase [Rhodoplanes tepidamans]